MILKIDHRRETRVEPSFKLVCYPQRYGVSVWNSTSFIICSSTSFLGTRSPVFIGYIQINIEIIFPLFVQQFYSAARGLSWTA